MKHTYLMITCFWRQTLIFGLFMCFFALNLQAQTDRSPIVDPDLKRVYDRKMASTQRGVAPTNPRSGSLSLSDESLQLFGDKVVIEAIASGDPAVLLRSLEAIGLENGVAFGGLVSGILPISAIAQLPALPALKYARPVYKPETNIGAVTSQGDKAQYSDEARKKFGVMGRTTKVGILSDSYNTRNGEGRGVASGDLPGESNPNGFTTPVEVLLEFPVVASDEGRAMAEIVHDVAPGASLAFNTAFLGQPAFAQGILNLAAAGCQVIVDDIIYLTEPMFQDGIIAQAADQVVRNGVSYLSSAGNNLDRSYESEFRDGGTKNLADFFSGQDLGEYVLHDFDPADGVDHFQRVTIPTGNSSLRLTFQWDDPFASACAGCPGANTEMDIFLALIDGDYGSMFIYPYSYNIGGDAVEFFGVNNSGPPVNAYIVIGKYNGNDVPGPNPNPGFIKYIDFGSGSNPEYDTKSSTSFGHANAALALSVGAVRYDATPAFGQTPPLREVFSSSGGVPIFFDKKGNRIGTEVRKKPEFSAPQGTNNTFFGFDYEGDGFPNFFGTSASAPHGAGVAALMFEAAGTTNLSPADIRKFITATAIDMEDPFRPGPDPGFDFGTGYGLVDAHKAVGLALLRRQVAKLKFASVCSPDPDKVRRWKVTNTNDFDIVVDWQIFKSEQVGMIIAKANSDTYFTTLPIKRGPNVAIIQYRGILGIPYFSMKGSRGTECKDNTSPLARTTAAYSTEIEDDLTLASLSEDDLFSLYPNPVKDNLSISFLMDWEEDFQIELIDQMGRILVSETKMFSDQNFRFDINMQGMKGGMYVLRMRSDTRTIVKKFIKN